MLWKVAATAALTLAASGAQARDWPDAGGWSIFEGDQYCYAWQTFEGPGDSSFSVAINRQGGVIVMALNDGWSTEEGKKYEDISFRLNGTQYSGGKATGANVSGKRGFTQPMNPDFIAEFVKSTYIHIYKGEQVIDRLDLKGSAAAVAGIRRCVARVNALRSAEEAEQRRYKDLPADPFAKSQ